MAWYLESRPNRPLHLTLWVNLDNLPGDGRFWALCGQAGGWQLTGQVAEKWRPRAVCKQCLAELGKLQDAAEAVSDV